jgi:hypothetical protein
MTLRFGGPKRQRGPIRRVSTWPALFTRLRVARLSE